MNRNFSGQETYIDPLDIVAIYDRVEGHEFSAKQSDIDTLRNWAGMRKGGFLFVKNTPGVDPSVRERALEVLKEIRAYVD